MDSPTFRLSTSIWHLLQRGGLCVGGDFAESAGIADFLKITRYSGRDSRRNAEEVWRILEIHDFTGAGKQEDALEK